ncbi:MAG: hypothetical protein JNM78_06785 [Cyclobacteriaceae bacterium]|nr:hypothetical protein [Cyclobacteriaceae bacterium]
MNFKANIIEHIETHSVEGIRDCFKNGINPNDLFNGEPLIYELISEYLRGPRFKECINAFVEYGLVFEDKVLLSVLSDDAATLDKHLSDTPEVIHNRYTLRCAFTPLHEATLLHICAEFNHIACAQVLVKHGADVNSKAGLDEHGFGGQSPIFHTVNQILNQSAEMLDYLLSKSADLNLTVAGLIWGRGYEWETFIPSVNPISYAMMGLLPQMHRNENEIAKIVSRLIKAAYGTEYVPGNIPNKYLK